MKKRILSLLTCCVLALPTCLQAFEPPPPECTLVLDGREFTFPGECPSWLEGL